MIVLEDTDYEINLENSVAKTMDKLIAQLEQCQVVEDNRALA